MDERVPTRTQIPSRKFAFLRWNTWPAIDTDDFTITCIKVDTSDNRIRTAEYFPVLKPPRERYQQADAGTIAAWENQRAIRAIWQHVLVWEVLSLVGSPSPRWKWPCEEVNQLQCMDFGGVWRHALKNEILEQIRTMAECSCYFQTLLSPIERYRAAKSLAFKAQLRDQCDCPPPSACLIQRYPI